MQSWNFGFSAHQVCAGFACDISPFHPPAGLEGDTDVQYLLTGGELVKVRSTTWKKMRYFKLQEDCKTIWHESHKKFKRDQTCECDGSCVASEAERI